MPLRSEKQRRKRGRRAVGCYTEYILTLCGAPVSWVSPSSRLWGAKVKWVGDYVSNKPCSVDSWGHGACSDHVDTAARHAGIRCGMQAVPHSKYGGRSSY
ncbi:hypothetical protein VTG60DRAFT_4767 [Thermothelomyces hinnuleus]